LIEEFSANDPRVTVFLNSTNQGGCFNFQTLLEKATGNILSGLLDDDFWSDSFLENLLFHARQSGAALTYGKSIVVDVELSEDERIGKEMQTTTGCLASLTSFARLDTDSIFYWSF